MAIQSNNLDIQIPTNHYVAFKKNSGDLPFGHMTYDGTDAAAQKRRDRMDSYAQYRDRKEGELPSKAFENKPMSGFKFLDASVHYYGRARGTTSFRIEDPRGFQLEISTDNLIHIMGCSTIENGEVIDKCVWGRIGNENVLIPVSSEVYKTSLVNTARVNSRVSLRDAKPGNTVYTHEALTGIYLGSMYPVVKSWRTEDTSLKLGNKRYIIAETNDEGKWVKIHIMTNVKLSEITDSSVITAAEAETKANEFIREGGSTTSNSTLLGLVCKSPEDFQYTLKTVPADITQLQVKAALGRNYAQLIIVQADGKTGTINGGSVKVGATRPNITVSRIDESSWWNDNRIHHIKVRDMSTSSYRGYGYGYERVETFEVDPADTTVSFNVVTAEFKTEVGNQLSILV